MASQDFDSLWSTANIFFCDLVVKLGLTKEKFAVDLNRWQCAERARRVWDEYWSRTWMLKTQLAIDVLSPLLGPVASLVSPLFQGDPLAREAAMDPRAFSIVQLAYWSAFETGSLPGPGTDQMVRGQLGLK